MKKLIVNEHSMRFMLFTISHDIDPTPRYSILFLLHMRVGVRWMLNIDVDWRDLLRILSWMELTSQKN